MVDRANGTEYELHEIVDPEVLWRAGLFNNGGVNGMYPQDYQYYLAGDPVAMQHAHACAERRRTLISEPSLPILPEVPSQVGSSQVLEQRKSRFILHY